MYMSSWLSKICSVHMHLVMARTVYFGWMTWICTCNRLVSYYVKCAKLLDFVCPISCLDVYYSTSKGLLPLKFYAYLFQQSCGIVFDYHCITFCLLRVFYNYRDAAWTKEFSSSAHQNQPFQIQPLKPQPIANLPMSTAASNWATDFLNQAPELKSSPAAGKLSGKL